MKTRMYSACILHKDAADAEIRADLMERARNIAAFGGGVPEDTEFFLNAVSKNDCFYSFITWWVK